MFGIARQCVGYFGSYAGFVSPHAGEMDLARCAFVRNKGEYFGAVLGLTRCKIDGLLECLVVCKIYCSVVLEFVFTLVCIKVAERRGSRGYGGVQWQK